jgi:RNA polymerase sigma-70 factor (ECF subfamily)
MGRDLATRVDVDDVVQSAFGSFFRAAREGAYAAPDGGELWQLLAAITRHKLRRVRVYHQARKRDVRRTTGGESALGLSDDAPPAAEWKWLVEDLFAALRPVERQIVELRMAGHLVAEIAARCGRSKRTIERVLQEVRDELCRRLEDPR